MESRSYDSTKPYLAYPYGSLWTCENCGDSGMTLVVQQCPQCQHHCCKNCEIYSLKGSLSAPLISNPSASSASERDDPEFKRPVENEGVTPLPSAEVHDLIAASDSGPLSSHSTPSSEAIPTTTSTQESNISSERFSYRDNTNSETELETDDTESTEDTTDDEDPSEAFNYAIDDLDSRLFSILGHDFALASRLIPQIHAQLQLGFEIETIVYATSPSHGPSGAPEAYGDLNASTSTPSNGSSHNSSPGHKRGRERGESKDRGDRSGPKRPRRIRDRSAVPRRRFACHFHKKDPARYCPLNDPKFNICLGRGNPQLRRMKDHYLKAHRPSQCERCYTIFKDREELKNHRQAEPPCPNQLDILKEGIDDSEWVKIEPLFHVQRKLSPSQKDQDDFDKWFQIWDILFPHVSRPLDPWVSVVALSSNPLPNDAEGLITNFNSLIEHDIEQGVLQRDHEVHQRYERAFRLALQTPTAVSASALSFNHPFTEMNEPGQDSVEHATETQNTLEILENSLAELVSSQPTPEHLHRPYQDHVSPRLDAQSAPSFSGQFDVLGDTHILQPSNESVSQMFGVPNTSNVFQSPMEQRGTSTTQQHLPVSTYTHFQPEAGSSGQEPIESPVPSNTEQTQDSLGNSDDSPSDSLLEDAMPSDNYNFEFDEAELDSNSLTKILEFENDDRASYAAWLNRHGRY